MSKPLLSYQHLHNFPANAALLALESFGYDGAHYCGSQPGAWESSERSWDSGDPAYPDTADAARRFGRWYGPGASHDRPGNLWLEGASEETLGHDVLARIASGASPVLTWNYSSVGVIGAVGQWRLVLQDGATGAVLLNELLSPNARSFSLPAIAGPAIVWMRQENAQREWSLPPDYLEVRGFTSVPDKFKYRENGVLYIWDFEADVGRRPTSQSQLGQTALNLWDEHRALVINGGLLHRGAWTQYISDGQPLGGPWSALRIAVGNGAFAVGEAFQPYPGAVLHRLDSLNARTPILLDALALSVSCWQRLRFSDRPHDAEVAGTIATRSGPATALWRFTPGEVIEAELLGITTHNYMPVCEASLYPTPSDLLEDAAGTRYLLSYSHLHEVDASATELDQRLPGVPRETGGHPGGRCLRLVGGELRFFTEFFGSVGYTHGTDRFAQFYNTLRTLSSAAGRRQARTGRGTAFHGTNCAEVAWGKYYGWAQDKPFGDPQARQYLAFLENEAWTTTLGGFSAQNAMWQRLRFAGGNLFASGVAAVGEDALWGVYDGRQFKQASLAFRPRRLTPVVDENGKEWLYVVGRFVAGGESSPEVAPQWSIIRIPAHDPWQKVCAYWHRATLTFRFDQAQAQALGLDPDELPPYLRWDANAELPGGGVWRPSATLPVGVPYLSTVVAGGFVSFALPDGIMLPYHPDLWDHFCLRIYDDGGVGEGPWPPEPHCVEPGCVIDPDTPPEPPDVDDPRWPPPPVDIRYFVTSKEIASGDSWEAIQVSDMCEIEPVSRVRKLHRQNATFPNLWARIDSAAPLDDLSTYTIRLPWNRFFSLPQAAKARFDVVVLTQASAGNGRYPAIDKAD